MVYYLSLPDVYDRTTHYTIREAHTAVGGPIDRVDVHKLDDESLRGFPEKTESVAPSVNHCHRSICIVDLRRLC